MKQLESTRTVFPLMAALALALVAVSCGSEEKAPPTALQMIPKDKAVILVNEEPVSGAWLYNWCRVQELKLMTSGLRADHHSLIDAGRGLLTKMVILSQEAQKQGLEITPEEIDEQLSKEMSAYESTQAWNDQLVGAGLSIDQRKEQIRTELLFNKYRDEVIAPQVRSERASDEQARIAYDLGLADTERKPFVQEHQVHLWHLLRSVSQDAPESERDRERNVIRQARDRISGGEKFEDVARELSTDASAINGGDMGWIDARAPVQDELKDVALGLTQGQLSNVQESSHGFHLLYASEVHTARTLGFDEVKDDLKKRLYDEWLVRDLEAKAFELQQAADVQFLDLAPYIGDAPPENPAAAPNPDAADAAQQG